MFWARCHLAYLVQSRSSQGPLATERDGARRGQRHGFLISAKSLERVSDCSRFSKEHNFQLPCCLLAWELLTGRACSGQLEKEMQDG